MSNISLLKEEFIVGIPIPRDPNDPSNMLPEQNFENLLKKVIHEFKCKGSVAHGLSGTVEVRKLITYSVPSEGGMIELCNLLTEARIVFTAVLIRTFSEKNIVCSYPPSDD
ncbi:hypothetical protein IPJ91_00480 [bacterium]|nr:MAG: hypothetical protein IPJ91_00480 [bacterium]